MTADLTNDPTTGEAADLSAGVASRETVVTAVGDADLRVLLMCLVHATGDLRWLEPPFTPRRDVRLVAAPDAGLSPEAQAQVREAVVELLLAGPVVPAVGDPGPELLLRMMRVCLGEQVPEEYAGMFREEMGFVSRDGGLRPSSGADRKSVLVIGAGASGIALSAQLGRLGVDHTVVERAPEVGGTWWHNRYPGCGVDTPNHAYSFSFGRREQWTRYFSKRDELQDYLVRSADESGVRQHVRFSTELLDAAWDEEQQLWRANVRGPRGDEVLEAEVLVSAIGALDIPRMPAIPGLDTFTGTLVQAARWPADLDLTGKRVTVIGTGATSMQLVPAVVDSVASLTVHQRSAQWVRSIDGYRDEIAQGSQWLLEHLPFYVEWFRFSMLWRYGDGLLPFLRKDPDWEFPDRSVNRINDRHRQEMADHLGVELEGRPDLLEKCLPSYPPYGKRILIDNGWYKALRRDHVELVTDPIAAVDATGVVTADGTHRPADVLVLATGFETLQMTSRLPIRGRDGVLLSQAWAGDNPTAHLGLSSPGFPNLFYMLGPNTGLAHGGSAIFQSECQARYITAVVLALQERGLGSVEVRQDVHDAYVKAVDAEHEQLIWTHPGMTNWYRNARGRVVSLTPWRLVDYWTMTHDPDLGEYVAVRSPRPEHTDRGDA